MSGDWTRIAGWTGTHEFSDCGEYRFMLGRAWQGSGRLLVACMLNPSSAHKDRNDNTIGKLMNFADDNQFSELHIVNLFSRVTQYPSVMMAQADPLWERNMMAIERAMDRAAEAGGAMLAAWGNLGAFNGAESAFIARSRDRGLQLRCLGFTASGAPKHPLARGKAIIPAGQLLMDWPA